jgi:threonine dehydrogenase-like Zn-dependent dehydrogenase
MGIVDQVGADVRKLKVGQRVVVSFNIACGKCDYCKREEYTACDTTNPCHTVGELLGHRPSAMYGYSHLTGGVPGKRGGDGDIMNTLRWSSGVRTRCICGCELLASAR